MANNKKYNTIKLFNWKMAKHFFSSFDQNWIFRGQRKESWGIISSLEREIFSANQIEKVESILLKEFKSTAHHYLSSAHLPSTNNVIDWLSIMQHSFCPTRLIDCTKSPYIASYFAFEKLRRDSENDNCAIWAINRKWCKEQAYKILKKEIDTIVDYNSFINYIQHENINELKKPFVLPIRPSKLNERMDLQQGYFLYLGNISASFDENIDKYDKISSNIIKLTIPNTERNHVIVDLDKMGINSATLFPGIDGFCKSLKTTRIAKFYSENDENLDIIQKVENMKKTRLLSFSIPNTIGALNAITSKFSRNQLNINIHTMFLNEMVQSSNWDIIMIVDEKIEKHFNDIKSLEGYHFHTDPKKWIES